MVAACSDVPPATPPATDVEAISLLGDTLRRPELADSTRARLERDLSVAESTLAAVPRSRWNPPSVEDASNLIWVGRRQAYLGRYREAIATFTAAIANQDPPLAHPYRHRGHRYITVRQLDSAVADLERAASLFEGLADEVEPDGQPNARGIPTSTLQFNVWYHLGLARYLQGDWAGALAAYERCREVSKNPDALVATTYWQYLTLRRLGERQRAHALLAAITRDLDVIENHAYHRLLLFYKGALPRDAIAREGGNAVQDVTTAYGLAVHDALAAGDTLATPFARIVETSSSWAAFGYIAAEAELARLRRR
jgi:tetratricopeptide (TPR) repeat protein